MKDKERGETPSPETVAETPQQGRRTRKRRFRNMPRPAIAVKGLLDAASPAEIQKARDLCGSILELWLGKTSKQQIARSLGLAPLRVWQLSQQALSGMIAGLLVQPRTRTRTRAGTGVEAIVRASPGPDLTALRKEIEKLKQDLAASQRVNELLKQFPQTIPPRAETQHAQRTTKSRAMRPKPSLPLPRPSKRPQADRPAAASPPAGTAAPHSGGSGGVPSNDQRLEAPGDA